ncbi:MAG: hypothetical protein ACTSUE_03695 [Promethearchaeota archaeon]
MEKLQTIGSVKGIVRRLEQIPEGETHVFVFYLTEEEPPGWGEEMLAEEMARRVTLFNCPSPASNRIAQGPFMIGIVTDRSPGSHLPGQKLYDILDG